MGSSAIISAGECSRRERNKHSLRLADTDLRWAPAQKFRVRRQLDFVEKPLHASREFCTPILLMRSPCLAKVILKANGRVERRHGALRNQGKLATTQFAQPALGELKQVLSVKDDLAGDPPTTPGQQAEQRQDQRAFARAAGANESQHFTAMEIEVDVVQDGLAAITGAQDAHTGEAGCSSRTPQPKILGIPDQFRFEHCRLHALNAR